uniref:Transmembrane protein n=1 Tax=Marseillevirus LCMAC102 TaxID=2506603 RepID=A0A481YTM7_9VIRU|nr:MAG: hypothetical protein LCMAC102_03270 [Marseillevirus LCMAC102]
MAQDQSQKFLFLVLISAFIFVWFLRCKCQNNETYSPYRRTGGCPPRTGHNYLDAYEQEDYYRKYPYVYPTPQSYTTALYAGRRQLNRSLKAQKEKILHNIIL